MSTIFVPPEGALDAEQRRQLLDYVNRRVGFLRHNGIRITSLEVGRTVFEVEVDRTHLNGAGALHGGVHATLLDSAMGIAALSLGARAATTQINVHYLGSVSGGRLVCTGTVLHQTRRIATAEARVVDAEGHLIAIGTGSFRLFEPLETPDALDDALPHGS